MTLTDKTTNSQIDGVSSEIITDLIALFRVIHDEIIELLYLAVQEGWSEEKLISTIEDLFGEEEVILDGENKIQ
jgi:hypothetical protein